DGIGYRNVIGVQTCALPIPPTDEEPELNRSLFLALQKLSDFHVPEEIYDEAEKMARQINMGEWKNWLKSHALNVDHTTQNKLLQIGRESCREKGRGAWSAVA